MRVMADRPAIRAPASPEAQRDGHQKELGAKIGRRPQQVKPRGQHFQQQDGTDGRGGQAEDQGAGGGNGDECRVQGDDRGSGRAGQSVLGDRPMTASDPHYDGRP